ncbi:uncharacterized protein ARMOST_19260 [Armillaria ostoyae]|uniref:DUF7918 domain-containing protein n=1 Tax=Armillaria ostoyae TaxID=47428 RepID=A0A284S431_ARMOS|nr:uncharacterized protein ARMOST_19260 [Armillaria ostoyae]
MVRFDSLSAWISVDDVPLPEFGEEASQADRKVTCWIPSEAGKKFYINWKHEELKINGSLFGTEYCLYNRFSHVGYNGTTDNVYELGTDWCNNDEFLHNAASSELGEIKVDLWVVEKLDPLPFQTTNFDEAGKIHERSKKAISHCAKTGDEVALPRPMTFRNAMKLNHLVTFIFRYRPLGILQANGIAPAPEPTPASHKRAAPPDDVIDISDDSDQEDSSSRIAKLEKELLQLKKRDAKGVRPEKRVKREGKSLTLLKPITRRGM